MNILDRIADFQENMADIPAKRSAPANLYYGKIAVGGRLFLLDDGLLFLPHEVVQASPPVFLPALTIQGVEYAKQFLFFDRALRVFAQDKAYRFIVRRRAVWREEILALLNPTDT